MAVKRGNEARPLLERSLTLKRRTFRGDYARAEFALARALVETPGDKARAATLARSARESFAKCSSLSFELREVEAWILKHPQGR